MNEANADRAEALDVASLSDAMDKPDDPGTVGDFIADSSGVALIPKGEAEEVIAKAELIAGDTHGPGCGCGH